MPARPKRYDQAYFDRFYRDPQHRVRSPAELARQVRHVVSTAEYVLGRPIRSVLDVGAGEGTWLAPLRALRPRVAYQGVDPSEYAVRRFGARRHLLLGDLASLDALPLADGYDLVVASGVLNYVEPATLRAALPSIVRRADGLLYLELFTAADELVGDTQWPQPKPAAWYRARLREAGLIALGLHCYVPRHLAGQLAELEALEPA